MYKNIVRLFLQANAYNQLSPLKPTIIRILESKHGPTYWIVEQADKMVETTEQRKRVSMGLTDSRKTAKNLADSRKNWKTLTVSRK